MAQDQSNWFFVGLRSAGLRDSLCVAQVAEAARRGINPYPVMEEQATKVPSDANGTLPILSDAMNLAAFYFAAPSFLNMLIDPGHSTSGSLFRALDENAAIGSAEDLRRVIDVSGADFGGSITFSSDASNGMPRAQILSEVLQRNVANPVAREAHVAWVRGLGRGQTRPVHLDAGGRQGFL